VRRTLEVDVPAGIADEQRIRLAGRGHSGERGGPPGDLYVLVRVTEDERFVRDGNDLVTVLDVPAPAAALGATMTVAALNLALW
jgi:molecular chaperone DnaJ